MVEQKAQKVLSALNILGRTERVDPVNIIRLYKCIVVPQLEYAAAVWQSGQCESLDKVQRRGLAICLGVPATASLEALEVEAGVLPLDLRREELAIREFGKIYAKQDTQPVKQALQHWENIFEESHERYFSPFGKMKVQMADMCSNTDLTINSIEPEADYQDSLQPTIKRPEYWNNLGSSKNRTNLQEDESRKLIERAIEDSGSETVFIFTDGSCKGNPGPCGAGACIYLPGQEDCIELKQPVSRLTSILLGELVAIVIALSFIEVESKRKRISCVKIFSDSQSAVGLTTLGWAPSSHQETVQEVKKLIDSLRQKGTQIEIDWTPGHANIAGNEIADRLAKAAAEEAENMPEHDRVVTAMDIQTAAKTSCLKKWQRRWDVTSAGRCLYALRKTVDIKRNNAVTLKFPRIWSQLRTGYCLNEYRHKIGATETPYCKCGEVESCEHYVEECTEFLDIREQLKVDLMQQTGLNLWSVDFFLTIKTTNFLNNE